MPELHETEIRNKTGRRGPDCSTNTLHMPGDSAAPGPSVSRAGGGSRGNWSRAWGRSKTGDSGLCHGLFRSWSVSPGGCFEEHPCLAQITTLEPFLAHGPGGRREALGHLLSKQWYRQQGHTPGLPSSTSGGLGHKMKADDDDCCPVWMGDLSSGWALCWALPGAAGILGLAAPGLLLGLRTQSSERLLFRYFIFYFFTFTGLLMSSPGRALACLPLCACRAVIDVPRSPLYMG